MPRLAAFLRLSTRRSRHGVENMQLQFGVDVDDDNTVDRYVNPGDAILTPGVAGYLPGSRVITARIWLVVRGIGIETGLPGPGELCAWGCRPWHLQRFYSSYAGFENHPVT